MPKKEQTKKAAVSKSTKGKAAEYTAYLLELHKLQGVLLTDLRKELEPSK